VGPQSASAAPVTSIDVTCTPNPVVQTAGGVDVDCDIEFDGGALVDGVNVSLSTEKGTWFDSGTTQLNFTCGQIGVPASCDTPITVVLQLAPGETGTNTVVATAGGQVGIETHTITAVSGTVPTTIAVTAISERHIGYRSAAQTYDPWINGTLITVRVTDGAGAGVNGRVVRFSTTEGVLATTGTVGGTTAADINAWCGVAANTNAAPQTQVATTSEIADVTGRARIVLCGVTAAAGNTAVVTATVQGTSVTTSNNEINVHGKPASADVTATVSGNTITANVAAPNKTAVKFIPVPSASAAVSPGCVLLANGQATATFAVAGGTVGQMIVSVDETDDGTCAGDVNTVYGTASVNLQDTPVTPAPSDGTLTAPTFGTGNVGAAVFSGGTIEQLVAQVTAAGGIGVWAQDANGVWRSYLVGGPGVVNAGFNTAFAAGFTQPTAVFVVR
jgi:hypothetical protein